MDNVLDGLFHRDHYKDHNHDTGKMDRKDDDLANHWTSLEPAKIQFLTDGKPNSLHSDQVCHHGNRDEKVTARCCHSLILLKHTYFQVKIVACPPGSLIVVGLAPSDFPTGTLPGNRPGSYGYQNDGNYDMHEDEKAKKPGLPFNAGDIIGCGINSSRKLFFTHNNKVVKTKVVVQNPNLYPSIGFDQPDVTVSLNTEAESPMEQCHSTAFTADYGHHHPGQMKLFEPEEQTSSLLLLPPFVIHKILQILGNILILETCRSAYLIIAPMFKWVDLPKLKREAVGYYADYSTQVVGTQGRPYSVGFELKNSGTYKSEYFVGGQILAHDRSKGTWEFQKQSGGVYVVLHPKLMQTAALFHPTKYHVDVLPTHKTDKFHAFKGLKPPHVKQ